MTTQNPFDSSNIKIVGEIFEYRKRARTARPIAQGTENLTAEQMRTKMESMTPQERQGMVEKLGMAKVLEILGE